MQLRPRQAWALAEIFEQRGGIGILGPGEGKTLITFILSMLMGWERPVLFVPAGLRDKTLKIDVPALSRHWKMPANLEVRSYEELSRDTFADYLSLRRIPDGIIADEVHYLKNRGSARTKRLLRYFHQFPETEFAGFSGSIVHRSVMDYGHLTLLALKDKAPLPHSFIELKTWADALDEGIPEYIRPDPGALKDFCQIGESPRDGYRRRLLETPAIISSPDLSTNIGLQVLEIPHPEVPQNVLDAFHRLRNTAELPGGEMCTTALDQTRHARELFLGFYLKWVWPDGKVDKEWLKKRKAWRSYVRKMTSRSHGGVWLDTEKQVANAVKRGEIVCAENELGVTGNIVRDKVNVYAEWVEIREDRRFLWGGKREPPKEVVWLSDYMLKALEKWSEDNKGIVWIESIGFMDKLRERGHPCFRAGDNEIELESGERSVFASLAHTTGKNLQMFSRMCFSNPLSSGKAWEQALGRQHRAGQMADDVVADVFLGCRETWWSFTRSRLDATYIESTLGQKQRLNMATIVATDEKVVGERCDRGDPLWAMTGHAKIDGGAEAFPILTELRRQAKEEERTEGETESEENEETANE